MSEQLSDVQRADLIVSKLAQDPHVQQIVADARLFDSLRGEPGWQRLFSMVQARKSKFMEEIASRLMGPKKNWPSSEEIAYNQGFYQGAVFVLAHPAYAEKNLEKAATVAWALRFEEDDEEDDLFDDTNQEVDDE